MMNFRRQGEVWFKVLINGENYSVDIEGRHSIVGFFVTRYICSKDLASAKVRALYEVDIELNAKKCIPKSEGTSSSLKVEEIKAVEENDVEVVMQGYSFYVM